MRFGLSAHAEVVDQAVQIVSEETQHMVGTHAALQAFFIEFLQYGLHALRIARCNVVAQAGFAVHGVFKIVQGVVLVQVVVPVQGAVFQRQPPHHAHLPPRLGNIAPRKNGGAGIGGRLEPLGKGIGRGFNAFAQVGTIAQQQAGEIARLHLHQILPVRTEFRRQDMRDFWQSVLRLRRGTH